MKLIDKIFNYFGYEKTNKEVTFTLTTSQFVNLIQSRGKFTSDQPGVEDFDVLLNQLSVKFGYTDWLEAYNKINHPSYPMEATKILDMSNVKRANYYEVELLELTVPKAE